MRLRSAVLDLMRGAAGASLVLAVGCSGSEPIRQEPAATLAPLAATTQVATLPPTGALPPSVVLAPATPDAVVTPLPPPVPEVAPVPEERSVAATPHRRRPRNAQHIAANPNAAQLQRERMMAACGRG